MPFHSIHWTETHLDPSTPEGKAHNALMNNQLSDQQKAEALKTLLQSNSTPAQCIALDRFAYNEGQNRWGQINPYKPLEDLVKTRMREQLASPPYVRSEPITSMKVGANHASAFYVMPSVAQDDDVKNLVNALKNNTDEGVLQEGIEAASSFFFENPHPYPPLVDLLKKYSINKNLSNHLRTCAVHALYDVTKEGVETFLIDMTKDSDLEIVTAAARGLGERDYLQHRSLLKKLERAWPAEDAGYDAFEVREMLGLID